MTMAYKLDITHNTRLARSALTGYRIDIRESDDEIAPFAQHGPVFNDIIHYVGVFATREEAEREAVEYAPPTAKLILVEDLVTGAEDVIQVVPADYRIAHHRRQNPGYRFTQLGPR
jgi:hypothetical protein